jgi:hypothetical protein
VLLVQSFVKFAEFSVVGQFEIWPHGSLEVPGCRPSLMIVDIFKRGSVRPAHRDRACASVNYNRAVTIQRVSRVTSLHISLRLIGEGDHVVALDRMFLANDHLIIGVLPRINIGNDPRDNLECFRACQHPTIIPDPPCNAAG